MLVYVFQIHYNLPLPKVSTLLTILTVVSTMIVLDQTIRQSLKLFVNIKSVKTGYAIHIYLIVIVNISLVSAKDI
jgi:hypothetical protein